MQQKKITGGISKILIEKIRNDSQMSYIVGKNAHLTLVLIFPVGRDAEVSATVVLKGEHATAKILGFAVGKKQAKLTLKTLQLHDAPSTTSNLLVKDLLEGTSTIHYDGRIIVSKKAHLTDAYQKNENLMISGHSHVISKPTLEILANDVRCTHGSTTGTIPAESLWYLKSRGLSGKEAQELMIEGFFEQAISQISDKMVQVKIRRILWQIISK